MLKKWISMILKNEHHYHIFVWSMNMHKQILVFCKQSVVPSTGAKYRKINYENLGEEIWIDRCNSGQDRDIFFPCSCYRHQPFYLVSRLFLALMWTCKFLFHLLFLGARTRGVAQEEVANRGRLVLRRKRSRRNQTHGGQNILPSGTSKGFKRCHKVTSAPARSIHESPWSWGVTFSKH